jgi:predicted transposase YbfD/YdcC
LSKKTLSLIISKRNHYLVKVKCNQKKLFHQLQSTVKWKKAKDCFIQKECNRGRKEKRIVQIYVSPENIKKEWCGSKRIIYVKRITLRNGKQTTTESYYLSSLAISAQKMAEGIRAHWKIENELHYVKDVVTHEDNIKVKHTNAAAIFSLFRNTTINAYRLNGFKSIKNAIRYFAGNLQQLLKFIE